MFPTLPKLNKYTIIGIVVAALLIVAFLIALFFIIRMVFSGDDTSEFADLLELANSKL